MPKLARLLTTLLRRTPPAGEPLSDAELLARFANARDAAAFELLVWRHGAMVLGVCRRVLRHEQSAEDAFQAVFLILAKTAGGVRTQLAGYLHTTTRRVCLRMVKRTAFAVLEAEPPAAVLPDALANAELAALLDAEIARLPEKFRLAVVLCYLRGLTTEQAAEQLNVPRGTVLSRLASARKRLVERLTAKGVTVPTAFLTTAVASGELAADVCGRTATAALGFVTSTFPVTIPSQLATEVLSMTTHKTVIAVAVAVVLMTGVGTGLGWVLAAGEQKLPDGRRTQPKQLEVRLPLAVGMKMSDERLILRYHSDVKPIQLSALQLFLLNPEGEVVFREVSINGGRLKAVFSLRHGPEGDSIAFDSVHGPEGDLIAFDSVVELLHDVGTRQNEVRLDKFNTGEATDIDPEKPVIWRLPLIEREITFSFSRLTTAIKAFEKLHE